MLRGKGIVREFRLDRPTVTLGRGDEADARLLEEGISRLHARITRQGADVTIEDLGSTNKTFVNGKELADPQRLAEGDQVGLGSAVLFRFTQGVPVDDELANVLLARARLDPLTGTFRRAYFDERLRTEFRFAQRHEAALAVAMIEVDDFAGVTEAHGQLGAEEALAHLGVRLRKEAGESLVARYASETFAILARALDADAGRALAEQIRRAVEATPFPVATKYARLTVSVGLAAYPFPRVDKVEQVVALAEHALAQAKARGKNRVVVVEEGAGREAVPPGK
ncbi:MAG TPA: GGDEF domain-containing protein [Streptosporangiaceae bacterium]|nr:GGDEF domain-containing protein [Streptosporangiaceae bacterium]